MKKSMLFVISLLTCCSVFAQSVKFDALSLDQALSRARAEGKFVFVDFMFLGVHRHLCSTWETARLTRP